MSRKPTPVATRIPTHRDEYVSKHAAPEFVTDEATGQYEGEELARIRARRPTDERIGRIEIKHDDLAKTVNTIDVNVAKMSGKLDTVLDFISKDRDNSHKTEQLRIGTRGKVIVGIVGALSAAITSVIAAALTGHL